MPLPLPPLRLVRYDSATAKLVYDLLTSVIVGHPQATQTYTFYEEIDRWLGPWGDTGYPIGYGKFYNIAFSTNEKLMGDPVTKEWVWNTAIALQEVLRDYIVQRIIDKTLRSITEPQLRRAAFESHPKAYTKGGLAKVVAAAPELIPLIVIIPGVEFIPWSPNFGATLTQVFETINLLIRRMPGYIMAGAISPAHTGIFQLAARRDMQELLTEQRLAADLGALERAIKRGEVDDVDTLRAVAANLNGTAFFSQGFAREARDVILAAENRQVMLLANYNKLLTLSPLVKKQFEDRFRSLLRPDLVRPRAAAPDDRR